MGLSFLNQMRILGVVAGLFLPQTIPNGNDLRLEFTTLPAPLLDNAKVNVVIEASGVEPIGDGSRLLVAHDKDPALYVVDARSGRILGEPLTSPHFPKKNEAGPKWEGMARDSDGNYYLIGAHNGKTDAERATKSVLIRFRLTDGDTTIDDASIITWHVGRTLEAVLKAEGMPAEEVAKRKVEGLSIREQGRTCASPPRALYRPPRAERQDPRLHGRHHRPPSPDAELELKPAFNFPAEKCEGEASELTSLEYVPALAGFVVITASEDAANAFHGNTLWFVHDGDTNRAQKVATFEVAMKAEGVAVLGVEKTARGTAVKLLITYDNDAHTTHIPSRIQQATLVRDGRQHLIRGTGGLSPDAARPAREIAAHNAPISIFSSKNHGHAT